MMKNIMVRVNDICVEWFEADSWTEVNNKLHIISGNGTVALFVKWEYVRFKED